LPFTLNSLNVNHTAEEDLCDYVTLRHAAPSEHIRSSRSDAHRALLINEELITFTPTEYRLLCILLTHENEEDSRLLMKIFSIPSKYCFTRKTLELHIDNIKAKSRPTGLSLRGIYRFGYALVVAEEDPERAAEGM
jgi:transcriptional antiterminator